MPIFEKKSTFFDESVNRKTSEGKKENLGGGILSLEEESMVVWGEGMISRLSKPSGDTVDVDVDIDVPLPAPHHVPSSVALLSFPADALQNKRDRGKLKTRGCQRMRIG